MVGNKISEIIALAKNYIKIIKKSQRKEEDFNLQSKELRQDALRCLWNKRISFEADEISLNEHKEIIKLLGNLEKGPINLNQMRLWSVIFNEFCNGMKFTKLYEESIMTVFKAQNYHIKNQTFKDKESQLLFYEALAKNFLIFKEDLTKSLKFCAKSCQIALKEMGITEQIRCFSTFAIVLLISGNNKLAAQVFDYLLAFQNNLGIRQNRSIYLSNAAECYLNAGYLQTAKSILSDALKELEKESTIHPHQLDVFINFAVLELLFGKNFNASKIIVKTEKFLNKSSINFHRWLRLKALNQWLVFKDLETSEKLIIKALGQESIGSSDILQTKIIYLKVLKESESSNFSKEKQEVEKWLEGRDELENIWNNYLESGNYFPKQIGIKKDKKLPLLKQKQISSLLEDILKKNIKKPKDSLN